MERGYVAMDLLPCEKSIHQKNETKTWRRQSNREFSNGPGTKHIISLGFEKNKAVIT